MSFDPTEISAPKWIRPPDRQEDERHVFATGEYTLCDSMDSS